MTKWRRNKNSFTVSIVYDKRGRARAVVPAPLIAGFDRPDTLTFELSQGVITVNFEHKRANEGA